ncbi:RluA family pseudouridine synthase [Vibrio rarus]|uniref:RluA family pseudouridine synthase n=1 Tax=Vibrio rarus TaxID=413403 RepID=UPI0021C37AA8|nr:RluA family pseudouridine synthase [Vibrio rarus]
MSIDPLFKQLKPALSQQESNVSLPERFTFPFYYEPHPLAVVASQQLQQTLQNTPTYDSLSAGKMFGVLVVHNPQGELGFLCAFSGKLNDSNQHPGFVPPVYDMLDDNGFFRQELEKVNQISLQIKELESHYNIDVLQAQLAQIRQDATQQITHLQTEIATSRQARKQQRIQAQTTLSHSEFTALQAQLAKQSVAQKNQLKWLKKEWADKQSLLQEHILQFEADRSKFQKNRAVLSNQLQHKIFAHYCFLNANGEQQDLNDIFAKTAYKVPPAGAGECAAPKLLQYAYQNQYKPIAMAEFWWGPSPKSEIRKHKQFYPSCMSKCHPILSHMLQGLAVDPNPLLENPAKDKPLPIVYEDEHIVVVNKPEGFLSVPGRHIQDSAFHRLIDMYPKAEGPFVLHRLDMATSGLLVFALSKRANKHLQKQFIAREVKKRYVALLEGNLSQLTGEINIPLCGDPTDRPRQMVCYEQGKPSLTRYTLIENINGQSKLFLYPETGRTHQLRVHCAHKDGLNMPMVGDSLYGNKSARLYLHAQQLSFTHPITQQWVTFETEIPF